MTVTVPLRPHLILSEAAKGVDHVEQEEGSNLVGELQMQKLFVEQKEIFFLSFSLDVYSIGMVVLDLRDHLQELQSIIIQMEDHCP